MLQGQNTQRAPVISMPVLHAAVLICSSCLEKELCLVSPALLGIISLPCFVSYYTVYQKNVLSLSQPFKPHSVQSESTINGRELFQYHVSAHGATENRYQIVEME